MEEEEEEDEEEDDNSASTTMTKRSAWRQRLPLGNKEQRTKALMNSYSQLDIATHVLLTNMATAEIGPKGKKFGRVGALATG